MSDLSRAISLAVERHGIEGVVTGALLSVYQAARVQRICRDLDLWCFNPLWYTDQEAYMERLIGAGFRAVVAGVFAAPFGAAWLGRAIDREALAELKQYARKYRITLTGEGGEYQTLVLDAPFFTRRIVIEESTARVRQLPRDSQGPACHPGGEMILLIDLCYRAHSLSHDEFVGPVARIAARAGGNGRRLHFSEVTRDDLNGATGIILCGTALNDNLFAGKVQEFSWLRDIPSRSLGSVQACRSSASYSEAPSARDAGSA